MKNTEIYRKENAGRFRVDMSSTAFLKGDWKTLLFSCRQYCESINWDFGIQLHNTAPAEQVEKLAGEGVLLSAHAPLNMPKNWNLAAKDVSSVLADVEKNIEYMQFLGIDTSVFHGALMSDISPEAFGHGKGYYDCMKEVYRKELAFAEGSYLNRDFTGEKEFALRYGYLRENLALIREKYPDFLLCIENDFPACGSMNMFPSQMTELDHPLCLDMGHLWISAHLADKDFHEEIRQAMASGLVKMCHFHASVWDDSVPKEKWSDGHMPLTVQNKQEDLPLAAKIMYWGNLRYFVLEITHGSQNDIRILHDWMTAAETEEEK